MTAWGHSRRSDGQQGFADVRYAFNGDRTRRLLAVATSLKARVLRLRLQMLMPVSAKCSWNRRMSSRVAVSCQGSALEIQRTACSSVPDASARRVRCGAARICASQRTDAMCPGHKKYGSYQPAAPAHDRGHESLRDSPLRG